MIVTGVFITCYISHELHATRSIVCEMAIEGEEIGKTPTTARYTSWQECAERGRALRGSKQASQLGRYMSAVGRYLRTGDVEGLAAFEGKSIGGHALITDPDLLSFLAQAGALTLDEIYALPESSS